jgi:hypothetical protein
MLCHTPFLVYGGKNYLKNLRKIGFKTFSQWWDESYDDYAGIQRILKIVSIVNSLANKPIEELSKMYYEMKDTLEYNYNFYRNCSEVEIK